MRNRGFTIFELLLVIVIILILAALLFPIGNRDPGRARLSGCASNEKQLGLGLLQYAQDNDQMMPDIAQAPGSPVTWRRVVYDYVKSSNVYQCQDRRDKAPGPDGLPRSYGANYSGDYNGTARDNGNGAFAGPGSKPLPVASFKDPANVIALCEVAGSNSPEFNIDDPTLFGPTTHLLWTAHIGGFGTYLFVDGHVKRKRPLETEHLWYRDAAKPLSANGLAVLKETQARAGH